MTSDSLRTLCFTFAALLLAAFGPTVAAQSPQRESLHFADAPFPPYVIQSDSGSLSGIAVEIAREACRRMDVECVIDTYPWERVLRMLQTGEADGSLLLMKTSERERYLAYTDPVLVARELFYFDRSRTPTFSWSTFADLRGYSIGLVDGYVYGEAFMAAIDEFGLAVETVGTSELNLRKLIAGRVDLVLEDEMVADHILATLAGGYRIASSGRPVSEYEFHLALSRAGHGIDTFGRLGAALASMRDDGTIEAILHSYAR